ncbi:MAG: hypothetical protein R6V19_05665 [Armatimonadota bacterium]
MRALMYREFRETWVLVVGIVAAVAVMALVEHGYLNFDSQSKVASFVGAQCVWIMALLLGGRIIARESDRRRGFFSSLPLSVGKLFAVKSAIAFVAFAALTVAIFFTTHTSVFQGEAIFDSLWFDKEGPLGTLLVWISIFLGAAFASVVTRSTVSALVGGIFTAIGVDIIAIAVQTLVLRGSYIRFWEAQLATGSPYQVPLHEFLSFVVAVCCFMAGAWAFTRTPILEHRKRRIRALVGALALGSVAATACAYGLSVVLPT